MTRLLVTVCPACATRFRITQAQLDVAGGRVRCGACLDVFDALANVEGDCAGVAAVATGGAGAAAPAGVAGRAPEPGGGGNTDGQASAPGDDQNSAQGSDQRDETGAGQPAGQRRPAAQRSRDLGAGPALSFTVVGAGAVAAGTPLRGAVGEGTGAVPDTPIRRRSVLDVEADAGALTPAERRRLSELGVEVELHRPPPRRWRIILPLGAAVLLLVAQYVYFQSDVIASSVSLRPWYERLCAVVGCTVPVFHDFKLLHSGSVVMRAHPTRDDVLLIDAQILNEAPYPQPFPDVLVEILDRAGGTLSSRVFTPMDYRRGELATIPLVPPNRPLQLSLEVLKPGDASVNFRFELQPARK